MEFKDRLKELRQSKGYSQQELADKLNVSKSTISMLEVGSRQPSIELLEQIANYFNVSLDYINGSEEAINLFLIDKIKELCKANNTTVFTLEQELGLKPGTLTRITTPNANALYKISKHFKVPMEFFFHTDDTEGARGLTGFMEWLERNSVEDEASDNLNYTSHYHVSAGASSPVVLLEEEGIQSFDDEYEYATVIGTSMFPDLKTGDQIKIKRQAQTTPSDFTLVNIGNNYSTVKFVEVTENGVWLKALNKEAYPDKFYTIQEVMTLPIVIIGKVVESKRTYK